MYVGPRLAVALAVVALATALVGLPPALTLSAGVALVAILVVADVLLAPRPEALDPQRHVAAVQRMGEWVPSVLRLHNPASRRVRIAVRDASPPSANRRPLRRSLRLPPGGWQRLEDTLRPARRGWATIGPVTIRVAGPLGLAGRQRTLPLIDRVKVYPPLHARAEVELHVERARLLQVGERSSTVRGGGTEFDTLREYHPDDEFRRINWRATARSPRPIANVYREERNQQIFLLLDASRAMAATVRGTSRFEHALDAAVAVAELAAHVGDHVGELAFGSEVLSFMGPRTGRGQSNQILDALFAVEPRLDAPNYRLAFTSLMTRHRRRALLVLFTELQEEAAMGPLFEALPVLLRRHLVMLAAVRDPDTEALARAVPETSEGGFLKAAAVGAIADRERSAGRLTRMGVTVVDGAPGTLAGRVADAYLRIKSLGRL
jgi:uncharacterized protein (DUF58 family)